MKKYIILCLSIILFEGSIFSQSLSKATIVIDKVDISSLQAGDKVFVPIRLKAVSDIAITGFQLFIEFDHSFLSWDATWENPESGIKSINPLTPFSENDWLFNDNGNHVVALWSDPKFNGIMLRNDELFFEIIFTYLGGVESGMESVLTWGTKLEQQDGKVVKGPTEIYDANLSLFELTLIDGAIVN